MGDTMKALWLAAGVSILAVGAIIPQARAEGPRASSENNWPGIRSADPGIIAPSPAAPGPRASSENNWPGIRQTGAVMAAPSAPSSRSPHYVWQEGYDHHAQWRGHWVLVQ